MLSNRESARRSRKRKQEQLSELEQQVKVIEDKNDNLESQCQAAAVHVQNILADKQRLENENQHLMSILQQLQVRLPHHFNSFTWQPCRKTQRMGHNTNGHACVCITATSSCESIVFRASSLARVSLLLCVRVPGAQFCFICSAIHWPTPWAQTAHGVCVPHFLYLFSKPLLLQKSIGEDQIRKHLPAALGGAGPIPSAARPDGENADVAAPAPDAAAPTAPLKTEYIVQASGAHACVDNGDANEAQEGEEEDPQGDDADAEAEPVVEEKRGRVASEDGSAEQNGHRATKNARTRKDSDGAKQNGIH